MDTVNNLLNGKKTVLAIIGWTVVSILFEVDKIDAHQFEVLQKSFEGLFGVGVVHKLTKAVPSAK